MTDLADKFRKLGRLSAWQWRVLLAAPFALGLTRWRLQQHGYRATLAAIRPSAGDASPSTEQLALARETAYALAVAVKYGPWRPLCLLRSLTLGWFLGQRGIPFEIRIGVPERGVVSGDSLAVDVPDFKAHAWVECGGEVLNDRAEVARTHRVFEAGSGQASEADERKSLPVR